MKLQIRMCPKNVKSKVGGCCWAVGVLLVWEMAPKDGILRLTKHFQLYSNTSNVSQRRKWTHRHQL